MTKEVELAAQEACVKEILSKAEDFVHENFSYDSSTGAWETRNAAIEAYDEGLRDAAAAVSTLICKNFGHKWEKWNDSYRRCNRCETLEAFAEG